jgi:tetratricopeptide (TPR) repeat protein
MAISSTHPSQRPDLRAQLLRALDAETARSFDEAERGYRAVLETDPQNFVALDRLAVMHAGRGELVDALRLIEAATRANPSSAEIARDMGSVLERMGRLEEAKASFERALALRPQHAGTVYKSAHLLHKLGRYEEALATYDRAAAIAEGDAADYNDLGLALAAVGRRDEALAAFARAIGLDPSCADAHFNRALLYLLLGDFDRGWAEYEWRWRVGLGDGTSSTLPIADWTGEPVDGKTVYLYFEQGFGDAIMFVRYVPLVVARGANVLLCVRPHMRRLLDGMPGVTVSIPDDIGPMAQYKCPLLGLPRIFGTKIDTIPSDVPYIRAAPEWNEKWRGRIPRDGRLNVGLVWAGGRDHAGDRARTVGFERFAALLGDPRVRYVSLHAELRDRDAALMAAHPDIVHFGPELQDFADTAGVISHLDLVISVDTAVAHLASAMAKPVWILLPFSPDFRWLLDRDDSPWYPTARLFRQPHLGDWESVIARVREALASLMGRRLETGA